MNQEDLVNIYQSLWYIDCSTNSRVDITLGGKSKKTVLRVLAPGSMIIIRDVVSDFSDEENIELCGDDDDDDEIDTTEPISMTYVNPSSFYPTVDSQTEQVPRT
ncbi:unnamed protein product [Lupinus luteus]|uniref:Uncharacterized protein n=1 Tax=Lupinus luteus TaxID=3873 RepID=A0AAV1WAB9_LUPLU